jgi:ATP-dependent DNA helicase RecG
MAKKKEASTPREFMEMAIRVMNESIQEPRTDKVSPKVGAVLVKPDGSIETASRGELRHGDHAEFTLLERKNRTIKLDGSELFATLEPCAPGARRHPKLGCAERIVNARIKKVWIGIEDPDPIVDRKGIKYLIDNGVEVEMFDADLQAVIRLANKQFITEAEERAKEAQQEKEAILFSNTEKVEEKANLADLSESDLANFADKAQLNYKPGTANFNRILTQLGLLERKENSYIPTGLGLLLFGERPQLTYPNSVIRATYKTVGRAEDIETIEGPLIKQADKIQSWYEERIGKQIDRSQPSRQVVYDYPLVVFREAIMNAIVHRDYDIKGAPIYFEINDDAIILKSPGAPVPPLTLEQLQRFNAPSLSRNPKIMYVFDQMKLVEYRGLGFQTIKELPEKYGLPLPVVTYDNPYMVFTFPRSSESQKNISTQSGISSLTDEELKGYDWIRSQTQVATKDYAIKMGYTQRTASRHLAKMLDLGLLVTNDENAKSPNLRYLPSV